MTSAHDFLVRSNRKRLLICHLQRIVSRTHPQTFRRHFAKSGRHGWIPMPNQHSRCYHTGEGEELDAFSSEATNLHRYAIIAARTLF